MIVKQFKDIVMPVAEKSKSKAYLAALAFGFSQFIIYCIFAALFYFGGKIIEANCENMEDPTTCKVSPEDVFIALFAIFFGASHVGTALSMGPDIAKAGIAATKVFKIIEQPSQINAIEIDNDSKKKRISVENIKGKIEFRNVWFRYPTRTDDFVLKGLNLTINPNESVALVGESGCGKSTFVNMMMRFYDPNFGEIFLDDINIKDINLHDLRKVVSLVMQEPSIFNYSILENILYGKLNASNAEVMEVANRANCMEFIEKQDVGTGIDETPTNLLKEMEENQGPIVKMIGQKKFDEEVAVLKLLVAQAEKKGDF